MALPWFLNPWREVLRLRKDAERRDSMLRDLGQAYCDERSGKFAIARKYSSLRVENSVLKLRLSEVKKPPPEDELLCGCEGCVDLRPGLPGPGKPGWRYACEKCGNKRCPHHEWHQFKCTGSNEPDQIGEVEK